MGAELLSTSHWHPNTSSCDGWNLTHILDHEVEATKVSSATWKGPDNSVSHSTRAGLATSIIFHEQELSIFFNPLPFVALCHSQPHTKLDIIPKNILEQKHGTIFKTHDD